VKKDSAPSRTKLRLPILYAGFLAFAVLAAWSTSASIGSHAPGVLPGAAVVDRQASPPGTAVSGSPVTASHPDTAPPAAGVPAAQPVIHASSPLTSSGPTTATTPAKTQIVPADGAVEEIGPLSPDSLQPSTAGIPTATPDP